MKCDHMPSGQTAQECECCGRELKAGRIEWLELNTSTGKYTANDGECPEADSQGWFPFGSGCAKRILKEQRAG